MNNDHWLDRYPDEILQELVEFIVNNRYFYYTSTYKCRSARVNCAIYFDMQTFAGAMSVPTVKSKLRELYFEYLWDCDGA